MGPCYVAGATAATTAASNPEGAFMPAALVGGLSVPGPLECKKQGIVVGQHVELPFLQQELEVAKGGHHRKELPVEGAVPHLSVSELSAEEGEQMPFPLQGSSVAGPPLGGGCLHQLPGRAPPPGLDGPGGWRL